MLKILVAPASYKGSIAAYRLARLVAEGVEKLCLRYAEDRKSGIKFDWQILEAPVADGGDDTLSSLHLALGGDLIESEVIGPVGKPVQAGYLRLPDCSVVELAWASGIAYLSASVNDLSPLGAHTYGTGQLVERAITGGAKRVVITVGGSASTDGGTGALAALGCRFRDCEGNPVPLGGGNLGLIRTIDTEPMQKLISGVEFVVATDVTSPLLGSEGAAAIFGPQKGASAEEVSLLDSGLAHYSRLMESHNADSAALALLPGAGAAGGAGFGFASALNATIVSGFHYLANLLDIERKLAWCDLVIVAEGRLDSQSLTGKGVGEIIRSAAAMNKTILALPASTDISAEDIYKLLHARVFVFPTADPQTGIADQSSVQSTTIRALGEILLTSSY